MYSIRLLFVIMIRMQVQAWMQGSFLLKHSRIFTNAIAINRLYFYKDNCQSVPCIYPFRMMQTTSFKLAAKKRVDDNSIPSPDIIKKKKAKKKIPIASLSFESAKIEIEELDREIKRHNALYEAAQPEISDAAYDKLRRRAEDIIGRFSELEEIASNIQTIGSTRSTKSLGDFVHSTPLKSLDNAFSEEEISQFCNKIFNSLSLSSTESETFNPRFIIEPKIDGLSLSLRYERDSDSSDSIDSDGRGVYRFVKAGTRGDGIIGDDITESARCIPSIPQTLRFSPGSNLAAGSTPSTGVLDVRGEVFISKRNLMELNQQREGNQSKVLTSARNAAAGILRQKRVNGQTKLLEFFAYTLLGGSVSDTDKTIDMQSVCKSQQESLEVLQSMGFQTSPGWQVTESIDDTIRVCNMMQSGRDSLYFDVDGAVIKLDDVAYQKRLGETSKYPRWAIAFKYLAKESSTTLLDIVTQVGRTGIITPVAVFEPIVLGGVTVERASLHNAEEIRRLNLTVGSRIIVKRAGDVIPKVVGLDPSIAASAKENRVSFAMPEACPSCGSPIRVQNASHVCTAGLVCPAQAVETIRLVNHSISIDSAYSMSSLN